jgi:hypothetical protein
MTLETRFKLMMGFHWCAVIAAIVGTTCLLIDAEREFTEMYLLFGGFFFVWYVFAAAAGVQAHRNRNNGLHHVSLAHRCMYLVGRFVGAGALGLVCYGLVLHWQLETAGWGAWVAIILGVEIAVIACPITLLSFWASRRFSTIGSECHGPESNTESSACLHPNP